MGNAAIDRSIVENENVGACSEKSSGPGNGQASLVSRPANCSIPEARIDRRIVIRATSALVAIWLGMPTAWAGGCPADMAVVENYCIDLREAPNLDAALPLVMYTFDEAEAWCQQRGKRLCFDDEWTRACAGPSDLSYPYGDTHIPGMCNDEETWLPYNQTLLSGWPLDVSGPEVMSLQELLDAARAVSSQGAAAADHVESLYQGEGSASNVGCVSVDGVIDLCGNIEEWTQRRDGGTSGFNGNLKGRYWAESRTCQGNVTVHGNQFRFYEIGFRCCSELIAVLIFADGFESGDSSAWSSTQ